MGTYFWLLLIVPVIGAAVCALARSVRGVLTVTLAVSVAQPLVALKPAAGLWSGSGLPVSWGWFHLDSLSACHLALLLAVFGLSTLAAAGTFRHEIAAGLLTAGQLRRFGVLWCGALGAMTLVLISNNLGLLWIGMETTTLVTAFLICLRRSAASLEAMWKYLLMGSVGVAFAFMGTLLTAAAARGVSLQGAAVMDWTLLMTEAQRLDLPLLRLAFLFLLVGFGVKAGLAPLHNWLPDAHSQAPAPVSALFSGFLLNTALYCILRYSALLEAATAASGWSLQLLRLFGLISIGVAASFILFQDDLKRLLAYCSVEHIGIISLAFGLGVAGAFAGLLHMIGHSLAKTLAFLAAGRIGQEYGTYSMSRLSGAARARPVWGLALTAALLALIGTAPFLPFLSKWLTIRAALDAGHHLAVTLFLAGAGIVFMSILRPVISMGWSQPEAPATRLPTGWSDGFVVVAVLTMLLLLGVWLPAGLRDMLQDAARIAGGAQ